MKNELAKLWFESQPNIIINDTYIFFWNFHLSICSSKLEINLSGSKIYSSRLNRRVLRYSLHLSALPGMGGGRGRQGMPSPLGQDFFIFKQFQKKDQIVGWAPKEVGPPLLEVLDSLLIIHLRGNVWVPCKARLNQKGLNQKANIAWSQVSRTMNHDLKALFTRSVFQTVFVSSTFFDLLTSCVNSTIGMRWTHF